MNLSSCRIFSLFKKPPAIWYYLSFPALYVRLYASFAFCGLASRDTPTSGRYYPLPVKWDNYALQHSWDVCACGVCAVLAMPQAEADPKDDRSVPVTESRLIHPEHEGAS